MVMIGNKSQDLFQLEQVSKFDHMSEKGRVKFQNIMSRKNRDKWL